MKPLSKSLCSDWLYNQYRKKAEKRMIENYNKKREHYKKEYGIDIGPLMY